MCENAEIQETNWEERLFFFLLPVKTTNGFKKLILHDFWLIWPLIHELSAGNKDCLDEQGNPTIHSYKYP